MNLPGGKTCGDCAHFQRCEWLISCAPTNTRCDWFPIRFRQHHEAMPLTLAERLRAAALTDDPYDSIKELMTEAAGHLEKMCDALQHAKLQIEYLHDKFRATGSGGAVLLQIEEALK